MLHSIDKYFNLLQIIEVRKNNESLATRSSAHRYRTSLNDHLFQQRLLSGPNTVWPLPRNSTYSSVSSVSAVIVQLKSRLISFKGTWKFHLSNLRFTVAVPAKGTRCILRVCAHGCPLINEFTGTWNT